MLIRVDTSKIRDNLPEHAPHGPSSKKRIFKCIPSLLPDGAIYQETSDAAQLGTDAHEAGEIGILEGKRAEDTLSVDDHGQDTIDAVNLYIDTVRPILERCGQWKVEGKFVYSELLFGTSDFAGIEGKILWIIDYKNGIGEVSAEENEQGLDYAGLVLVDGCGFSDSEIEKIETVKIVIVQPRASGESIKTWECSVERVEEHIKKSIVISNMTEDEIRSSEYHHGDHCFFCPRKINCPKLDELTSSVMAGTIDNLTPEQLGKKLAGADILESRIKALRDHAYTLANFGSKVSGFKLVNKRAIRKWIDESQTVDILHATGYDDNDIYTSKIKSPAQIEKLVGKKNFDDYAPYAESISSGTTLVKDSDRRMEVIPKKAVKDAIDKLKAFNLKN